MHVKVVVPNSALNDARVLKEADSLAAAGHEVTVIGLYDPKRSDAHEHRRPSGVRIRLTQSQPGLSPGRILRLLMIGAALIVAAILGMLANNPGAPETLPLFDTFIERLAFTSLFIFAILGCALGYWFHRMAAKFRRQTLTGLEGRLFEAVRAKLITSFRPLYTKMRRRGMTRLALQGPTDIVHCHDLWSLPVGAAIKHRTGALLVWDAHEIYEEVAQGDATHADQCRKLLRQYQGDVDHFITINESIAEFYKTHYPSLPEAIIVKNATPYTPRVEYDGRMHDASHLPRTQKIALYQGVFAEKRGLRLLVQAAEHLNPDWTLVMMGWGKLEAELKAMGERINATRRDRPAPAVVFLPAAKHSELVYWTAGGTVGLIPYENVGLNHLYCTPNKLWEYPAARVPILCSPLVELTKTVQANGIGWLLPDSTDARAIAVTINGLTQKALKDASLACEAFIQRDNWAIYSARIVGLYKDMEKRLTKNLAPA